MNPIQRQSLDLSARRSYCRIANIAQVDSRYASVLVPIGRPSSQYGRIGMLPPCSAGNDMAIPNDQIQRVRRDHRTLRARRDKDGVRFTEVGRPIFVGFAIGIEPRNQ